MRARSPTDAACAPRACSRSRATSTPASAKAIFRSTLLPPLTMSRRATCRCFSSAKAPRFRNICWHDGSIAPIACWKVPASSASRSPPSPSRSASTICPISTEVSAAALAPLRRMCALQRGTDRMNHAVHDFGPIRFSTDDLPARDRIAMWRELFGRRMLKAEFEAFSDARFCHTTTFRNLCGLTLGFSAAAGFRGTRTRQLLGDGSDDLLLTINTQGVDYLSQFGREARAGPFDGVMMSCAEWAQFSVPKAVRFMLVAVPRRPIAAMVKDPEAAAGRLLRKEMESLRLLTSYLSTADGLTFANPELRHLFVMSVYDLMALTFGATSDAA